MGGSTDYMLLDAVRRRLRHPAGWLAVCLHLSRVAAPGVRPHHRLIARVLMEDTARRYDGEVFSTSQGDLLLLCQSGGRADMVGEAARSQARAPRAPADERDFEFRPPTAGEAPIGGKAERVATPEALPTVLSRLLRADIPDAARIISFWSLETDSQAVLAWAHGTQSTPLPRIEPGAFGGGPGPSGAPLILPAAPSPSARQTAALARLASARGPARSGASSTGGAASRALGAGPVRLQFAMILSEGGAQPLFREVSAQSPVAATRAVDPPADPGDDPFLARYLARQADRRVLLALEQACGRGGPLDPLRPASVPMHVNLSLEGVGSEVFIRLARRLMDRGRPISVEVPLLEAVADPEGFESARRLLRDMQAPLILDEVTTVALRLVRASALRPDGAKLAWSPRLAGLGEASGDNGEATEGVVRLLAELGSDRVVLTQTASEEALRWGLAHGIRRFQGPQVDATLRAARMARCAHAGGCTPAQCSERAAAATTAARRLCWNHPLLDGDRDAAAMRPSAPLAPATEPAAERPALVVARVPA